MLRERIPMQNSVWKIVAVVGIIGIGTLVVLEVQHRLPQMQNAVPMAGLPEGSTEIETLPSTGSENFYTPDDSTDFDRLISGETTSDTGFQFSEPDGGTAAFTEAAVHVPPGRAVDTTVRRSALYEGDSPFQPEVGASAEAHGSGDLETAAAVLASGSGGAESEVRTVAYQQRQQFGDDDPFGSVGAPASAASGQETPRFPALGLDAGAVESGDQIRNTFGGDSENPFGDDLSVPAGPNGTPDRIRQPKQDENIMFFGAAGQDAQATPAADGTLLPTPADGDLADQPFTLDSPADSPVNLPAGRPVNGDPGAFGDDPFGGSLSRPGAATSGSEPVLPLFGNDPADTVNSGANQGAFGDGPRRDPSLSGTGSQGFPDAAPEPLGGIGDNQAGSPSNRLPDPGQPKAGDVEDIPFFTEDPEPEAVDPLFPQPDRQPVGRQPAGVPLESDFGGSSNFGRGNAPGDFSGDGGRGSKFGTEMGGNEFGRELPGRLPSMDRQPGNRLPANDSNEFPPLPDLPGNRNAPEGRDFSGGSNGGTGSGMDRPSRDPFDNSRTLDSIPRVDPLGVSGGNRLDIPERRNRGGIDSGMTSAMPVSTTEIMRPHVTLRKDAPETASVGVPLEYVITVVNEGQSTAYEVIVEDEVARGVDLQNTVPVADFDRTTRRLQWRFAELQPNEKQQIKISVTPTGEGTLDSTASVRFKAQVKASTVITAPRLSLQLTGPSEVKLGDEVNFRYLVRNDGTGMATDVLLRSVLPAGLKHSEGNDLEYEINTLAANEEREVVLTVVAVEPGVFRNAAEITNAGVAAAADETTITIVGSQLKVERLGPERRYVGRPAQFQNIVSNETNFEAIDCVVMEQVPVGMKFVSAPEAKYNPQDRIITWQIDRIAPGKQVVLDVELTAETPGQVDTIVEVLENAGFRSRATKTVAVEDIHNVSADISRLDGPVAVGEKFTFSITVDNRGTAGANEVQLSILVPKEIDVLAAGSKEDGIKAGFQARTNSVVFDPIVLVEPGQVKTFQLMLQGQQPVRNALVKAQLKYAEMQEPLVVSESVTIFSDSL